MEYGKENGILLYIRSIFSLAIEIVACILCLSGLTLVTCNMFSSYWNMLREVRAEVAKGVVVSSECLHRVMKGVHWGTIGASKAGVKVRDVSVMA